MIMLQKTSTVGKTLQKPHPRQQDTFFWDTVMPAPL